MAADSNMGFHQGVMPSALQNLHMLSFQSGGGFNDAGPVSMGSSGQIGSKAGVFFPVSPSGVVNNSMAAIAGPSSSASHHLDLAAAGIKQESGLSPEWTIGEQNTLKQGFIKYAGEHSIKKYIKIAAMLDRKTVRDVALRCRWLAENSKRRKLEEYYTRKRMYSRKEKMVDSCSNANRHMVAPGPISSYSPMMPQVNQNNLISCEVPAFDGATQQLLDENNRILHQISTNLATYQIQENINLFCHLRNNFTAIQNNMSNMPGIMSQMPPLPVPVNEELLNSILFCPNQFMSSQLFRSSSTDATVTHLYVHFSHLSAIQVVAGNIWLETRDIIASDTSCGLLRLPSRLSCSAALAFIWSNKHDRMTYYRSCTI